MLADRHDDQLTVRLAYNLFTQKPKEEKEDFLKWTKSVTYRQGSDYFRHNGAGEMLVFSAADFEDFREPRPDLDPGMEGELEDVVRILAENRWPWRMHATYDETISRALDVFEKVNRDIPLEGLNWFFDHAETISDRSIDRIAALGGGGAASHGISGRILRGTVRCAGCGGDAAGGEDAGTRNPHLCRNGCHAGGQLQSVGRPVVAGVGQDCRRIAPDARTQPAGP